jgi:hypothetical protein
MRQGLLVDRAAGPLFDGLYEYRHRALLLGREPG